MFCEAVKSGAYLEVERLFNEFMAVSISIRDTYVRKEMKKNFYHGMLLGLLQAEGSWSVRSSAESGGGWVVGILISGWRFRRRGSGV